MITLNFLVTSLIVVLIPGTGVLYTISTGLTLGRRASLLAALGCTAGIVPQLLATVFGLSAVMQASAVAFQVLKYAGVAYLFYLAYAPWRDRTAFAIGQTPRNTHAGSLITKAILLNLLNPKLTLFFLAFLPQFIVQDAPAPLRQLLTLSGICMVMPFAVFVRYGFLADAFRKVVIESPRVQTWLRRGFAAAFAGRAVNLALSER
jgi:threonine/homoserine/homoserine lactone efflux protein